MLDRSERVKEPLALKIICPRAVRRILMIDHLMARHGKVGSSLQLARYWSLPTDQQSESAKSDEDDYGLQSTNPVGWARVYRSHTAVTRPITAGSGALSEPLLETSPV